ncbi:anti-sigma factor antagonist [Leptospira bourretii]|uniref:Anti-sigma factor antagonist n=7 Tax=Leptospiraceae TaxID=170 RepID=A0A4R9IP71_9LEPT|nr:STAS domain-containing protein [Leptospira kanakyensis]MCG6139753.1 STAS domain-containing protein [Leptospira mtsangambouensis]PJZ82174.1 anti-sigma factor antagonist [Leptospira meyeri]PJZ85418.1 anti-sigma factor antagonist [Leptospira harrisiae]PKA25287.1 anti-sigma factor antagonist [Leptospira sp. mixed culture ATI2-C-A1]TGK85284.1 anti-sigma factor antagonist [Leptospira bourretii]TGL87908.1 anti-sigma factor antagonist [Leptospira congkakensis]
MLILSHRQENHLLLSIQRDVLMENSREFYQEFEKAIDSQNFGKLTMDFHSVKFLDSSGIGAVIKASSALHNRGVEIFVTNLNKNLNSVFRLSGLNHILSILTLDEYLSKFPEFQKTLEA